MLSRQQSMIPLCGGRAFSYRFIQAICPYPTGRKQPDGELDVKRSEKKPILPLKKTTSQLAFPLLVHCRLCRDLVRI